MKTLIVPTDFSKDATNATIYAYHLASMLQANLTLCHSFVVPVGTAITNQAVWPIHNYETFKKGVTASLNLKRSELTGLGDLYPAQHDFHPNVEIKSHNCALKHLIASIVGTSKSNFAVMGLHGAGLIDKFLVGSNARDVISTANYPVMLIPRDYSYQSIKKIAFATDFRNSHIQTVQSLAKFASYFEAAILLVHISGLATDKADKLQKDNFLNEVTNKVNYPKIYYLHLDHMNVDNGLKFISEDETIDLLAIVHAKHNWFEQFINPSHARKLAETIGKPLLVLPEHCAAIF